MRSDPRLLLLLLGAACRPAGPIVIGDGFPRPPGRASIADVARLALDSSEHRRAIEIQPWTLVTLGSLDAASAQAELFATTPGLIGVVGHAGSRDALLASMVYNASGVAQLVPNATSRRLSSAGPWTFPMVPHDGVEGETLVGYALDSLRLTRITVVYVGDEYGSGLRDGVREALRTRGLDLNDQVMVAERGCEAAQEFLQSSLIVRASLARARPDVVILATSTPAAECIAPVIAAAQPDVWLLAADGVNVDPPRFASLPASTRRRFRAVVFRPALPDSGLARFEARARRIIGRAPSYVEALMYDGYMLLAAAAEASDGSREGVRRWLTELGTTRPLYRGITGPIGFAEPRRDLIRLVGLPELPR